MRTESVEIQYSYRGRNRRRLVEAEVVDFLCVHETHGHAEYWTITHVGSGRAIWRWFETRDLALTALKRLADLPGWHRDEADLMTDDLMRLRVAKILDVRLGRRDG